ncbi:MAG: hypothetical protein AAGJ84_14535 [Pseudomonadota bacterium]
MSEPRPRQADLTLGLIIFGMVSLGALIGLFGSVLAGPVTSTDVVLEQADAQPFPVERDGVTDLLATLAVLNPGRTQTLLDAAPRLPDDPSRRIALLQTSLAVLRDEAPYLRYASLRAYTDLLLVFGDGMAALDQSDSPWCSATSIADLTRENEDELMPSVLQALTSNDQAFDWSTRFLGIALKAAQDGRRAPVRHGSRTANDEAVVQFYGRQLGVERLAIALAVASFSHAEGRDFATMRSAIEGVDVCALSDAFIELSNRLPGDVKGRVMSELAPEVFYGNTPYVLYLLRGYFFVG